MEREACNGAKGAARGYTRMDIEKKNRGWGTLGAGPYGC